MWLKVNIRNADNSHECPYSPVGGGSKVMREVWYVQAQSRSDKFPIRGKLNGQNKYDVFEAIMIGHCRYIFFSITTSSFVYWWAFIDGVVYICECSTILQFISGVSNYFVIWQWEINQRKSWKEQKTKNVHPVKIVLTIIIHLKNSCNFYKCLLIY